MGDDASQGDRRAATTPAPAATPARSSGDAASSIGDDASQGSADACTPALSLKEKMAILRESTDAALRAGTTDRAMEDAAAVPSTRRITTASQVSAEVSLKGKMALLRQSVVAVPAAASKEAGKGHSTRSSSTTVSDAGEAPLVNGRLTHDDEMRAAEGTFASTVSEAQRAMLKREMVEQYKDRYRLLDFKIKSTAPANMEEFELPPDHQESVGEMNVQSLREYGVDSNRKLISVYGRIYDVSAYPWRYGAKGPYPYAGKDITYLTLSKSDSARHCNQFFDLFKTGPEEQTLTSLREISSWVAFYQKEFGEPVGFLEEYMDECSLPAPPSKGPSLHGGGEDCRQM